MKEDVRLATINANMQLSEFKSSLASERPVYYYSVYLDTLQIKALYKTRGKALGFELMPLLRGDELIPPGQALAILSTTAEKQKL